MDWITPAQQLVALITALIGLIGTGIGAYFTIRGYIKAAKEKSKKEIWNTITTAADAAIKQAEESGKSGADKKQMVIDIVKASCEAAGLDISLFIDQLGAYIDDCIKFVNDVSAAKPKKVAKK